MKDKRSASPTDLFPFIDVLTGFIGVLCLVMVAVSLGQTFEEDPLHVSAVDTETIRMENARLSAQLKQIERATIASRQAEAGLNAQLDQLSSESARSEQAMRRYAGLARMTHKSLQLRSEISQVTGQTTRLLEQVDETRQQIEQELVRTQAGGRIHIHFSGSGLHLKPYFIECDAQGVVLHSPEGLQRVSLQRIRVSKEIGDAFRWVRAQPERTVTLLVRPDGITTCRLVQALADQRAVSHGKLPIPGEGRIDLGAYLDPPDSGEPDDE